MTSTPNPTWYDVLGVSRDASPDEIKAAWRLATDKFEPGTGAGQFRMFNEAADVLLDPVRRAAYDASLDDPGAPSEPPPPPAPAAPDPTTHVDPKAERREARARRREEKQARTTDKRVSAAPASRRSMVVAGVLAVLSIAAVVVAVLIGLKVRTDNQVADARQQAPAAAEQAAKAIFAYD